MKNLEEFYTQKVKGFDKDIDELNQKLFSFSALRLIIFSGTVVAVYFASVNAKYVIGVLCVGIPLFLFLVTKYSNLKYLKSKKEELKKINSLELKVQKGIIHYYIMVKNLPRTPTFSAKI